MNYFKKIFKNAASVLFITYAIVLAVEYKVNLLSILKDRKSHSELDRIKILCDTLSINDNPTNYLDDDKIFETCKALFNSINLVLKDDIMNKTKEYVSTKLDDLYKIEGITKFIHKG